MSTGPGGRRGNLSSTPRNSPTASSADCASPSQGLCADPSNGTNRASGKPGGEIASEVDRDRPARRRCMTRTGTWMVESRSATRKLAAARYSIATRRPGCRWNRSWGRWRPGVVLRLGCRQPAQERRRLRPQPLDRVQERLEFRARSSWAASRTCRRGSAWTRGTGGSRRTRSRSARRNTGRRG